MPRLNRVAESFLDGVGCLGAIVEPVVRPGSMDNLIQVETEPYVTDLAPSPTDPREVGELIWLGIALACCISISVVLPLSHRFVWVVDVNNALIVGVAALFVRAAVHVVAPTIFFRSKRAGTAGAKASHGV